jgi:response regulator RpfG family c-di-GMP phosphodiesterase
MRILLVDDDAGLRALLRTTFEAVDVELEEADNAASAVGALERAKPDVIVLDVRMPGMDGLELCRRIKSDPRTQDVAVVLLTGSNGSSREAGEAAGCDAFILKPFSPLELLSVVERLAGGLHPFPFRASKALGVEEQLQLYARDLRHLLEIERGQRILLQEAYKETVAALASALETKDTGTRAHSQRVQRYAVALAQGLGDDLADDPSAEYGFLLHDVGKIGIPDSVLQKPGPLGEEERRLMQTHTVLGEQMLRGVAFLHGPGLEVGGAHHERWDGGGYPDGLAGSDIPLGARIFAVADTLDAMTSDRPYRPAGSWRDASAEIRRESKRQFDPSVVKAFAACEQHLRAIRLEFTTA